MAENKQLQLIKDDNLLKKFEEIHNFIYANEGLSTQQVLDEIVHILFLKIFDENNNNNQFYIEPSEYSSVYEGLNTKSFIDRINNLHNSTVLEYTDIFEKNDQILLSNDALAFVVNKFQNINLSTSSGDIKGLAFQKFLSSFEKGDRGQFFTPEQIIDLCVNIISPTKNEKIIDPACGSGGFLLSSLKYLKANSPDVDVEKYVSNNLFGIDINKKIARLAKMKLFLESNGNGNIILKNSLADLDEIKLEFGKVYEKPIDKFDIVLTNPPFGTLGKIKNKNILSSYELGYKWSGTWGNYYKTNTLLPGQVPEILFIERCLALLKDGGRLGIVLPNGHFENSSLGYLRSFIKDKAKLSAIIKLPQETFIPFGTGVKVSLLFLEKLNGSKNNKVFFSKVNKLGYKGNKNGTPIYKKNELGDLIYDDSNNKIPDEDISVVISDYQKFQNNKNNYSGSCYDVDYDKINGRFDYKYYSPEFRNLINNLSEAGSKKLSDVVTIISKKSSILKNRSDTKVFYIELSDINTHSFEIYNSTENYLHQLPSRASYELENGDIITAVAGNSIGTQKHATALVTKEFVGAICTNGFRILRNPKIDPYYLLYFLSSEYFLKQISVYRTGAAIPAISDKDLKRILIPIPDENTIKNISSNVREALGLRLKSKKILSSVSIQNYAY